MGVLFPFLPPPNARLGSSSVKSAFGENAHAPIPVTAQSSQCFGTERGGGSDAHAWDGRAARDVGQ
jgi:hypothetical protein